MRPQILLVRAIIVLSMGLLWPMKTHAQKCDCTKNHKRLFENPKESWKYGEYKDDRQLTGHPYSTFSKTHTNSYTKGTTNAKERLDNLRAMVQDFQKISSEPNSSIREAQEIYPTLYELADKKRIKPDFKIEKKSKYPHNIAYIAKAAAFVYLCDMKPDGTQLPDTISARFRNTAIYCLNQITENEVNGMLNTIGLANLKDGSMSTYAQRYSKNLIMYAQAYDYLRAVSDGMNLNNATALLPQPLSTSTYAKTISMTTYADLDDQLNWCGLYVQCYAENLYSHVAFPWNTPLYRVDNHATMSATALGLAGIILNDYTHKSSKENWHPDLWANTAHQVIDRVLYTENIGPIVLGQTQKGGLYGYQEGPYYLKWGSENMLPFMLAFKNFHPESEVNKEYVNVSLQKKGTAVLIPLGTWASGPVAPVGFVLSTIVAKTLSNNIYNARTLEINYMDDENIINMYKWATELERPNGTLPTMDDSWDEKPFFDKAILRKPGLMRNYLAKGYSHNLKYDEPSSVLVEFGLDYLEDKSVDLRADIYAAFAEGFYNDLKPTEQLPAITAMPSGDVIVRNNTINPGLVDYNNYENMTYLHINIEDKEQGQFYLGQDEGAHEHNDHFAISLTKGDENHLIDNPYFGFTQSKIFELGDALKHNTIIMDGEETPDFGSRFISVIDPTGEKVLRVSGTFADGKIEVIREIRGFDNNEDELTVVDFINPILVSGIPLEDPANHTFTWSYSGYGNKPNGTFDNNTTAGYLDYIFQPCKGYLDNFGYENKLQVSIKEAFGEPDEAKFHYFRAPIGPVKNDYPDDPGKIQYRESVTNIRLTWENRTELMVVTSLEILACNESYKPKKFKPRYALQYKGNGFVKAYDNGNKKLTYISLDTNLVEVKNPLNETDTNKIAKFRGNGLTLTKDTARGNGTICDMGGWFVSASARNSNFLQYDSDTVFTSNKRFEYLQFDYIKKFIYEGLIKTDKANTKVWFYLTDFPWASQSLMKESNGFTYEYDTVIKAMQITFDEVGVHRFRIGPVDECITSCFFPPVEITNHFEFNTGTTEVLGHNLAIKQAEGYLDIDNGSKMKICEDNYCINRDSITIFANAYWRNFEGPGFKADYRTTEDAYYREPYEIGSSAWDEKRKTVRSMIIVEKNAALVLADSSYTQIGNGGTILVKPGGTLKILDGAKVVVGGPKIGFGEIIMMDSSYLCIEPGAILEFYNDTLLDTTDRNIFFISKNPINPAIEGVAPNAPVSSSASCIDFCSIKSVFPTHGLANEGRGWINVGKPEAKGKLKRYYCNGQEPLFIGSNTLNETQYQFIICKADSLTGNCTGSEVTSPIYTPDHYYGGRIDTVNLDTVYAFTNGSTTGATYKVRLKVKNDCNDSSEISQFIHIRGTFSSEITGDSILCSSDNYFVHGRTSTGDFNKVSWEVFEYRKSPFEKDSASFFDTFLVRVDTFWIDTNQTDTFFNLVVDTVVYDTIPFNKEYLSSGDSIDNYYRQRNTFDTTIYSGAADTLWLQEFPFESGKKYSVVLSLSNGCNTQYDTLIIRTKDGPEVSAGPDKYIPYGTPNSPDPELEGSVGGTATSYVWSPSSGLSSVSSLTPKATPTGTTNYVLSATDADGCTNYDTVLVFVNTVANATRDTTICYTDSIQVGVAAVSGYTYEWSPSNLVSNANIAQPYAYPKAFATTYLKLQVFSSGNLVGIDDVVIYKDTLDSITFDINPGAVFFEASFGVYHTPVSVNDISWNFDDGTGSYTSMGTNFTYSFPNTPSTIYDVCASFTNACGTQASCKDCEFDMMGNVIPQPPKPNSINETNIKNNISVWPNPFTDFTVLEYNLTENNNAFVEITDLTGKVIKTIRINDNSGKVELNLSQHAEGVYQYRFINGNLEIENGKLVLVR